MAAVEATVMGGVSFELTEEGQRRAHELTERAA